MFINVMDAVSIRVEPSQSSIANLIFHEYQPYLLTQMEAKPADILITFKNETIPRDAYRVKAPVSYDEGGVFLFDQKDKICRIDFSHVGETDVKVSCHPEFNPHFFAIILEYLIHLKFVGLGAYFCHSCAFEFKGKIILCPAWRNVGKTNLLLSFLQAGAKYIADDWSLIFSDGRIRSLSKRLNLFYYNFSQYPELTKYLNAELRNLVQFTMHASKGYYDLDRSVVDVLEKKLRIRVPPHELAQAGIVREAPRVDYVFLLQKALSPEMPVELCSLERHQLTIRVLETIKYEQQLFGLAYSLYKAKTGQLNLALENYETRLLELIQKSFATVKNIYQINILGQQFCRDVKNTLLKVLEEPDAGVPECL